jgi:tetratricopeptide (TPR) repeat protein
MGTIWNEIMRQALAVILLLVLIGAAPPSARANDIDDCTQGRDIDRRISGCTRLLKSGRLSTKNRAITFIKRGLAFSKKSQYDRAISDHTQAIRLNPRLAAGYINRGSAYGMKGQYDRAIADYASAIQINIARQSGWERRVNQDENWRPVWMIVVGGLFDKSICGANV